MSTMTHLEVTPRIASGKSEVRRVRKTGKVPAVAYSKGQPGTPIAVEPKDVITILKSERGRNSVISMKVAGKDHTVMIKDYSYHPVTRSLEHVDFAFVALDKEVEVEVPLIVTGKPAGVTTGGILRQVYRKLPVRCLPNAIPVKLEIDVTHLNMSEAVSTQELKLPPGVTVLLPAEQTLAAVVAPEKEKVEDVAATGAVPGVAGAAPAAGAGPAAGAKDAKGAAAAAPAKDAKKK